MSDEWRGFKEETKYALREFRSHLVRFRMPARNTSQLVESDACSRLSCVSEMAT